MRKVREIRCKECGDLLFKVIDEQYIEIVCGRKKHKTLWEMPNRPLTDNINIGKIVLK